MLNQTELLQARVLIVDDQPDQVHLLMRILLDEGYTELSSTTDPHQVCALHLDKPYDLILLDLQMPGLDGFAVMQALRAETGASMLPVMALTAQPGHKLRALQAGARDFISKPFDMVEVKLRIHHMLEVRLLHKALQAHAHDLERIVLQRTAELRDSEARARSLTHLAVDLFWEQNEAEEITRVHGPVLSMLGLQEPPTGHAAGGASGGTWDAAEQQALKDNIAARRSFLDLALHRQQRDGSRLQFRISGEPMLDSGCRFVGYRGVGVEVRLG
jgi:DNA-binding response OmpR family regulator